VIAQAADLDELGLTRLHEARDDNRRRMRGALPI